MLSAPQSDSILGRTLMRATHDSQPIQTPMTSLAMAGHISRALWTACRLWPTTALCLWAHPSHPSGAALPDAQGSRP